MSQHPAHEILAQSGACEVEHCPGCDLVHVHFGHASVRLTPAAFRIVCRTLLLAMRRLAPQDIEAAKVDKMSGHSPCH